MTVRTAAELQASALRIETSVAGFNSAVGDFADSIGPAYLKPFHQKIHLQALKGVVLTTPVGKRETWAANKDRASRGLPPLPKGYAGGHARRNWQSSTTTPAFQELEGVDASGNQSLKQGDAATVSIRPFSQSFISNAVPYIEQLEAGSSTLAPAGMVALTVNRLRTQVQR